MQITKRSGLFLFLSLSLACGAATASDTTDKPAATAHGPVGLQRDVRQVQLRFNREMVAFGGGTAADAAVVACDGTKDTPKGHWIDGFRWVAEFERALPDGVVCTVQPQAIKTLKGEPVAMPLPWTFTTGGPRMTSMMPDGGNVRETPVTAFAISAPVDPASLSHLQCTVNGKNRAAHILAGAEKYEEFRRLWNYYYSYREMVENAIIDAQWIVARCGSEPWPASAKVIWRWGKQIASPSGATGETDTVRELTVRPPFSVEVSCLRLAGSDDCDPRSPVRMTFSEKVLISEADRIKLHGSSGKIYGNEAIDNYGSWKSMHNFRFTGDFSGERSVRIDWPAVLKDVDGRALVRSDDMELPIRIARSPAYIGLVGNRGTVAALPGRESTWPLAMRNSGTVKVKRWQIDGRGNSSESLLALHEFAWVRSNDTNSPRTDSRFDEAFERNDGALLQPFAITKKLLDSVPGTVREVDEQIIEPVSPTLDFSEARLPGRGTWLIDVDSLAYRETLAVQIRGLNESRLPDSEKQAALRKMILSRTAIVQNTNLAVSTQISDYGDSLVWITAYDNGRPVAGASLEIWSCDRKLQHTLRTDGEGRAVVPPRNRDAKGSECAWVIARLDDDVAVLRTSPYSDSSFVRPAGHTVTDRLLYSAGETMHMQHFARELDTNGWHVSRMKEAHLRIYSSYYCDEEDLVHEQKLVFKSDGSASSEWTIPQGPRLGHYCYVVKDDKGSVISKDYFQIEEFRTPVYDASLNGTSGWKGGKPQLHLKSSLSYMAGGPVASQPVTLKGRYYFDVDTRQYVFDDQSLGSEEKVPMQDVPLALNKDGRVEYDLVPPDFKRPVTLYVEMQFADASGETQAVGKEFVLFPTRYKTGLRIDPVTPAGKGQVSVITFDEHDKPMGDRTVTIEAEEMLSAQSESKNRKPQSITVCTIRTDRQGKGSCEFSWAAVSETRSWWFRARADEAYTPVVQVGDWKLRREFSQAKIERMEQKPARVGSVDRLQVKAPFLPATLLLSVWRDGLIASQVHHLTNETEEIGLPIQANYAPLVKVRAYFVRGVSGGTKPVGSQADDGQSIDLATDPDDNRLKVTVKPARKTARPGQSMPVRIAAERTIDGKPAAHARLTMIALDEAMLELKGNSTWDVLAGFTGPLHLRDVTQRALALTDFPQLAPDKRPGYLPSEEAALSIFKWLVPHEVSLRERREALYEESKTITVTGLRKMLDVKRRSPGNVDVVTAEDVGRMPDKNVAESLQRLPGVNISQNAAGSGGWGGPDPRSDFSSLAFWRTDIELDGRGEAVVKVPLNDLLTRWKIVAIVAEGSDHYGMGEASVSTSKPLELIAGLPQAVRSEDVLRQKLTLRNRGRKALNVQLNAAAAVVPQTEALRAGAVISDAQMTERGLRFERTVTLKPGENRAVEWPLSVPSGVSRLHWLVSAKASNGEGDALRVTQSVMPAVPVTVRESILVQVDRTQDIAIAAPPAARTGEGGVAIHWAASMTEGPLRNAREWMRAYPFNCIEQQISRAAVSGDPSQWSAVMDTLPRYVKDEGLVAYFPETDGSVTLTTYLLDLAATYRLPLPPLEKARMEHALASELSQKSPSRWQPDHWSWLEQRLAIQAVLPPDLRRGEPVVPDSLNDLSTIALIDWIRHVLTTPESPQREERLMNASAQLRNRYDVHGTRLTWRADGKDDQWWFMQSTGTAIARTILLLQQWPTAEASWRQDLPLMVSALIDRQRKGSWGTTTANAWSVAALGNFAKVSESDKVDGTSVAAFGGEVASRNWPKAGEALLPWHGTQARGTLSLSHKGAGTPWAAVRTLAASANETIDTRGISVKKTLSAMSQRVPGKWSEGDIVRVTLDMQAGSDLDWVVVRDPVPSGASILGKSLGRESQLDRRGNKRRGDWHSEPSSVERANDSYRGYYERVKRGSWKAEYLVRLNNAGTFNFPPTRIEAMYAPEIFGEAPNAMLKVEP